MRSKNELEFWELVQFISISKGTAREFFQHHPTSAELVIEIGHASVNYDRGQKGSLYAKAGIPEYWLVNIADLCVEVYRDPVKAKGHFFGWKYAQCQIYKSGETITPLCLPGLRIAARELLP